MFRTIAQYWKQTQQFLFPQLRQQLPNLLAHHIKVVEVLEVVRVEEFLGSRQIVRGRPPKSRAKIARAFVAKATLNFPTTKILRENLLIDHNLRIICGWDLDIEVPSESTLSRAFSEFAEMELPERMHAELIPQIFEGELVDNLSRDATHIVAREKSKKKKVSQEGKKAGPKAKKGEGKCALQRKSGLNYKELLRQIPTGCDSGSKVSAKGTRLYWVGYKLHADVTDCGIPISCHLTSASTHDSQLAIPLSEKSEERVQACYELMDSAYDCLDVKQFIEERGRIPIVDPCPRTTKAKSEKSLEKKARFNIRWRPPEAVRLDKRTCVERFFSELKDSYGGRNTRVKGPTKVSCHLMLGVIALTAVQLIRLIE